MRRVLVLLGTMLATSLVAGLAGAIVLMVLLSSSPSGYPGENSVAWLSWLLVFGTTISAYAVIATTVLGLPFHAILSRVGWRSWPAYAAAGLIVGVVTATLAGPAGEPTMLGSGLAAGLAGGMTFWWLTRRDDRPSLSPT